MEEAIFAELTADSALATKLNAGSGRYHIYPLRVPENVHISQALTYAETTQILTYPALKISVFRLTAIADTFVKARDMANDLDRIFTIQGAYKLGRSFPVVFVQVQSRATSYDEQGKLYHYAVDVFFKY